MQTLRFSIPLLECVEQLGEMIPASYSKDFLIETSKKVRMPYCSMAQVRGGEVTLRVIIESADVIFHEE